MENLTEEEVEDGFFLKKSPFVREPENKKSDYKKQLSCCIQSVFAGVWVLRGRSGNLQTHLHYDIVGWSLVYLFLCSFVHLFTCLLVHLFICSIVHLFIVHLFIGSPEKFQPALSVFPTQSSWVLLSATWDPGAFLGDLQMCLWLSWGHLEVKVALQFATEITDIHHKHCELVLFTFSLLSW